MTGFRGLTAKITLTTAVAAASVVLLPTVKAQTQFATQSDAASIATVGEEVSAADRPVDSSPASPVLLDRSEISQLEARQQRPGPEVNGGALSNEHLTYIVIAIAAAVIVLILV